MAPFDKVQWRDCQAWREDGLPISTTSNEAAKLLDLSIGQIWSVCEIDRPEDGLQHNIIKLKTEFPDFAMGQVFSLCCTLDSQDKNYRNDKDIRDVVAKLQQCSQKAKLNKRELMHIKAVTEWANGHLTDAAETYEAILLSHPIDSMAYRFAGDQYFYTGNFQMVRDGALRILPFWNKSMPIYPYIQSHLAFGFEELSMYPQAESHCKISLEMAPENIWAHHTMAHFHEMQGLCRDGADFLEKTYGDWKNCSVLTCHVLWHWGLFLIEKGDFDGALAFYDSEISKRSSSTKSMLNLCDAVSFLKRLELEGVNVGDRWEDVIELARPHSDDHIWCFDDIHLALAFLNSKNKTELPAFIESLKAYIAESFSDTTKVTNSIVSKHLALPLCEAVVAYQEERYDDVIGLIYPIRHRIRDIGGSDAQRDLYILILLQSCIQSKSEDNHKLARALLNERKGLKKETNLEDRMMAKLLACHE